MRTTPHSSTSWRRVRVHTLRRVKGAFTLAGGVIVALLSYWLGYEHGSFQQPRLKEQAASATPVPEGFKRVAGYPDGNPDVKYGATPIRSEP
jgi:hypothetical protein